MLGGRRWGLSWKWSLVVERVKLSHVSHSF